MPVYARDHEYASGVLRRSFEVAPDGTNFLFLTDNTIDPNTGLVTRSAGPDGFASHSRYDFRGRLIASWRDEGATTCRTYELGIPGANRVRTETLAASGAGCGSTAGALTFAEETYDGLGRLILEKRRRRRVHR